MQNISLFKLFWIFFKISAVLFGGGYAMLPFLQAEIVEKEKICTSKDITDFYAISQCFPGLVAGNVSMLIGYKAKGIFGAIVSIIGVCLPAFLSIVLVFSFLTTITEIPIVQNIFSVLDLAVCVLIFLTIIELWRHSINDKFTVFIFLFALISALIFNISPFVIVITAALLGLFRFVFCPKNIASKNSFQNEIQQNTNTQDKENE